MGAYLLAASYGAHEVTNYLHTRFCDPPTDRLCDLIVYHDDGFSLYLFFAGFTIINVVTMLTQLAFRRDQPLTIVDNGLIVLNALFALLWRAPRLPLLRYYAVGYVTGLALTAAVKIL